MTPIYVNNKVAQKFFDLCKKMKVLPTHIIDYVNHQLEEYYIKNHVNDFWDD